VAAVRVHGTVDLCGPSSARYYYCYLLLLVISYYVRAFAAGTLRSERCRIKRSELIPTDRERCSWYTYYERARCRRDAFEQPTPINYHCDYVLLISLWIAAAAGRSVVITAVVVLLFYYCYDYYYYYYYYNEMGARV
jgi:hypothetical protein